MSAWFDRLSVILFFLWAITSNLLQLLTFYWKTKMEGELLKGLHFSSKWLNNFHWTKPVHQQATFLLLYFSMLHINFFFFLQWAHTEEHYKNIRKLLFIVATFWQKSLMINFNLNSHFKRVVFIRNVLFASYIPRVTYYCSISLVCDILSIEATGLSIC